MLPPIALLKNHLQTIIAGKAAQGHEVKGLQIELRDLPESYDALQTFAEKLAELPLRPDWPYVEPNEWADILAECDPKRPTGRLAAIAPAIAVGKAQAAFEAAVAGCILGKPLEVDPTLDQIRSAAQALGQWPINDYITEALLDKIGRRHPSWPTCCRGRIHFVESDDDINYAILGLIMLQKYGFSFTKLQLVEEWTRNLPFGWTYGPERTLLAKAAMNSFCRHPWENNSQADLTRWVQTWNPLDERCGAAIRVDAYGYACPGRPDRAAELAWRDSSWTHRRTGIYGSMFIAAAIATAFVESDRLKIFQTALQFVPQRSRFHQITADCLEMVRQANDWLDGYGRIHAKYGQYGHCQIFQEVGTTINTAKFAGSVDEAITMQVSQGCDTDCFGKIIGSIMGAYFGPGHLSPRWLEPFNDMLYTSLGEFHEQSLAAVTRMMGRLAIME